MRLMVLKKYFLFYFLPFLFINSGFSQNLVRIKHFGKNKGHLKMYAHLPAAIDKSKSAPLVVVLHGCLQCAGSVASQTGWNKLADENGFYVLYPQQRLTNNPEKCFKWYKRKHVYKNRGENASIKMMVDYMKINYRIDSSKVYITGLSAGAAMGAIMMADYPETFNSGAIFAGAPYKVATSMIPAAMAFMGWRIKSPEKWGDLVRNQNPFYKGNFPRMIIYQGNNDRIVNKRNGVELMKQWTNVHGISVKPSESIPQYLNNPDIERNVYRDKENKDVVIFYKINHLGHALLIDPGKCKYQGGRRGFFARDKNYFSTLFTAYDFGLVAVPAIVGKTDVFLKEDVTYTVPLNPGSIYQWTFPTGCTVIQNDNSNSLSLSWGASSGCINVTETDAGGCKKQYQTLFVNLKDLK